MIALFSLVVVIATSLLIVRVAAVALTLTGVSEQLARFQARSAFTGAGFTTGEAEKVVQHPVRRRIVMLLMLLGNAGLVSAVSTLMLSFVGTTESEAWYDSLWFRGLLLFAALGVLWLVTRSQWFDQWLNRVIKRALDRWTDIDVSDYASLLNLTGGYTVSEILIEPDDWVTGRMLKDLRLGDEGVLVLGIQREDGSYVGAPRGDTEVLSGDALLLYGRAESLRELDERAAGSEGTWAHYQAVHEQRRTEAAEHAEDKARVEAAKVEAEEDSDEDGNAKNDE